MVSAHPFVAEPCQGDIKGLDLGQSRDEDYVGEVSGFSHFQDWAMVEEASTSEIDGLTDRIADQQGFVNGHITESGIEFFRSNELTMYNYGAASCLTDGVIEHDVGATLCSLQQRFLLIDIHTLPGDSGGPHYDRSIEPFEISNYIIGVHVGRITVDDQDYALVSAAYDINDEYGIDFNPSPC